jgi:leader peptidase (prepilin peptidase)/N-methyltransferase
VNLLPDAVDPTALLLAQSQAIWALKHVPAMVFVFCFGASVGSFLNVVVYRLPAGMSVISPPSRCPTCGARLRFFSENLPILGWFLIRGKCRYCAARVSPQYMIIEVCMAIVFLALYVVLFTSSRDSWWGQIGGPWWTTNTFLLAWPAYMAFAFLIAGLVAMTMIDARTFTIPIEIPTFVTVTAFLAYAIQAFMPMRRTLLPEATWPLPGVGWGWALTALLGMAGVLVGVLLLRVGKMKYSFADYEEYVEEGEVLGDYPHARREMGREILFLLPCIVGIIAGRLIAPHLPLAPPPVFVQAMGATFIGYLSGGALIWGIRILGTLGFGKEAMGLGDVHLLAAVGAVLGWFDPILIFFVAPFSGILWALVSMGFSRMLKTARRELPYGPHLAVATIIVMVSRPAITKLWAVYFPPALAMPEPGLLQ